MKSHGAELREEYDNLEDEELDEFRELVTERRQAKETAVRDKPKARLKDMDSTFKKMKQEVCRQSQVLYSLLCVMLIYF